jgi:homoserine dehydrogenase
MSVLRVGLAGLGTVGGGVLKLIARQEKLRLAGQIQIGGVSARSRYRTRGIEIDAFRWFDDPVELAASPDIDVLVELVGGSDGTAKRAVETALQHKKHVVTANKALLAHHGRDLANLAEAQGVNILFEAAVAGGVPIVRALRESLAGVEIREISGILNGTCNYILTAMAKDARAYADVLKEAQALGYAEADPTLDVSGLDAFHKAVLLGAMAFGAAPDLSAAELQGIDGLDLIDLRLANKLGYRIKLIARAMETADGVVCDVRPTLLRPEHPLASIDGALNAVLIDGDPVGRVTLSGPGAGEGATASAVMGDLGRLFDAKAEPVFGTPMRSMTNRFVRAQSEAKASAYFMRIKLADRPGSLAALTEALARTGLSVETLLQEPPAGQSFAPVGIIIHAAPVQAVRQAVHLIGELQVVVDAPVLIRIEAQ